MTEKELQVTELNCCIRRSPANCKREVPVSRAKFGRDPSAETPKVGYTRKDISSPESKDLPTKTAQIISSKVIFLNQ